MKLTPVEAYDRWADTYDDQTDNVVLALESALFTELLGRLAIEEKVVIDIGCGTGRHWPEMLSRRAAEIVGVDPSHRMLERLRARYPSARALCAHGDHLEEIVGASSDVVVSTLALAHIPDAARAIREWSRVLRPGGAILLTDFHPHAIRAGMKRTFVAGGKTFEIEHHATDLPALREIAVANGLIPLCLMVRVIDESVRLFYERAGYIHAYEKNKHLPLVFGMHLFKPA